MLAFFIEVRELVYASDILGYGFGQVGAAPVLFVVAGDYC